MESHFLPYVIRREERVDFVMPITVRKMIPTGFIRFCRSGGIGRSIRIPVYSLICGLFLMNAKCVGTGGAQKEMETVTFRFVPVRADWKGTTSDTVLIAVSVVYRGIKGGNELPEKKEQCETVIREFGRGLDEADFTDTSRYDAAHERLKGMLNGILEKGRVETVVFRSVGE